MAEESPSPWRPSTSAPRRRCNWTSQALWTISCASSSRGRTAPARDGFKRSASTPFLYPLPAYKSTGGHRFGWCLDHDADRVADVVHLVVASRERFRGGVGQPSRAVGVGRNRCDLELEA